MGSNQSSHADFTQEDFHSSNSSVRGRKATSSSSSSNAKTNHVHNKEFGNDPTETTDRIEEDFLPSEGEELEVPYVVMEVDEEEDDEEEEEESDEEEDEEEYEEERERILEDMKQFKILADMYLHPEKSVQVDGLAFARCFFDRPSAVQVEDEMTHVLQDALALKTLAVDYLHPELPVTTTDPTACARCYFDRPSAPEQEEEEDRARILEDVMALKQLAVDYLHPEMPVVTTDATAFGRNYFTRPSAPEQEDVEAEQVLEDAKALKKLALDYLHPEMPVVTTDPTIFGRNYFTRPSAQEVDDEEDERAQVLADMAALKKLAVDYLHPEMPVAVEATAFGRNYFTRPSAPEEDDEREQIIADMSALKKLAVDYLHPEMPVVTTDPTVLGRNYFTRPSAPEQEEDDEEREQVMADMAALKKLAVDYLHPEQPVVVDPAAFGRNYFTRPSAPQVQDDEEREQVMTDMAALKKIAVDYLHPESPVSVDATAFGRNYFTRPSAPEMQDDEEREQVMADMAALKKLAVDYLHPEMPVVTTDPTAFGRNYFTRPSAPEVDDDDDEERAQVLADMAALKKLAVDYLHPEKPVSVEATAFGRNYFTRPSAPEMQDDEELEQVMEDMAALKKLAVDYLHPEMPVVTTDPTASGRNYFTRASAPQVDDDNEERAQILADMAALKKLAVDYLHPEMPVAVEATAFGRNYFTRPSAPEQDDKEEREQVMADMVALKKLAVDYLHPEMPVVTTDPTAFGRNYFTRPSAPEVEDQEEHEQVLADMVALKKLAVDYAHPELPVVTTDPTVFGRNYFTRASAPEVDDNEEHAQVLSDVAALKKLAVDYLHPELPVVTTDPTAFGRNYFTRPSAPEDQEELEQVMADVTALKKLAIDYAHPELPVVTTDPTVFGRNYFMRPSAPAQESSDEGEERKVSLEEATSLKKSAVDYAHPELPCETTDPTAKGRNYFNRPSAPGHAEHISTSGYANNNAAAAAVKQEEVSQEHYDYDHYDMEEHHEEHHDQFEMDEDIWSNMYSSLHLPGEVALKGGASDEHNKMTKSQDEEEEGKLSRSPSSVMLFEQGGMEGY